MCLYCGREKEMNPPVWKMEMNENNSEPLELDDKRNSPTGCIANLEIKRPADVTWLSKLKQGISRPAEIKKGH